MDGFPQVGFIKNFLTKPNIIVGDYSYYDDPNGPENFEKNLLYHYPLKISSSLENSVLLLKM